MVNNFLLDSIYNPRRWKYIPPPWIQPYNIEAMYYYVFSKLFEL